MVISGKFHASAVLPQTVRQNTGAGPAQTYSPCQESSPARLICSYLVYCLRYPVLSLNNSMEWSHSWKANGCSAAQHIAHFLRNSDVHYCFHKHPPPDPALSYTNPVHTNPISFFEICFYMILPPMPWSSKQVSFLAICRPISCKHF